MDTTTLAIDGLSGSGTVTNVSFASTALTIGSNNGSGTFSGVLENGSGALNLTKTGSGTEVLSGANTYTGATNVNAGLLVLNGSVNGSVTVSSGGLLTGTGTINGNLVNSGQIDGTTAPTNGLVSRWSGDGNANDSVGSNNGTLVGSVGFTTGQIGQAFSFNGSDYVQVPTSTSLNPTTQVTLEAWINPNASSLSGEAGIAGTWNDLTGNNRTYFLWLLNGVPNFYISNSGSNFPSAVASAPLVAGQWYHIVGTFDGTNIKIYVNGVLQGTTAAPGPINTNTLPFYIGQVYAGDGERYFNGQIDEVNLYNRALDTGGNPGHL